MRLGFALALLALVACNSKPSGSDASADSSTAAKGSLPSGIFCAEGQSVACYEIDADKMRLTLLMNDNRGTEYDIVQRPDGSYSFAMSADKHVAIRVTDNDTLSAGFGPKTTKLKRKKK